METYVGFDSAWTDKSPGAICAVVVEDRKPVRFHRPELVTFDRALEFIKRVGQESGFTLVALDQPTLVPNATGMRPVERVAASVISWMGGGVQPANTGKLGMFCHSSPIWRFLESLGAIQNPEEAQGAIKGVYLIEVFPALALASLEPKFFARLGAPKYNPANKKKFRKTDWKNVADVAAREARLLDCEDLAKWCDEAALLPKPDKTNQDQLDAVLCLLTGLRWRLRPRRESLLLGDLPNGYMVLPMSEAVYSRLATKAQELSVPIARGISS